MKSLAVESPLSKSFRMLLYQVWFSGPTFDSNRFYLGSEMEGGFFKPVPGDYRYIKTQTEQSQIGEIYER